MDVVKTFAIYVAAAMSELGGTYCFWRWLKEKGPGWLPVPGILALLGYAVIQTYQPESRYGRVYAAYAGIFLVGAMLWGHRPRRRRRRALRTQPIRLKHP